MQTVNVCVCVNLCLVPSPCFATRLHVIGECDIVWPHVELPLSKSQHATVHTATVNANAHVNVDPRHLAHQPADTQKNSVSSAGWNFA